MGKLDLGQLQLDDRAEQRVERLRQQTQVDRYPLCTERLRLFTEAWEQTRGQPKVLRLAQAFAHLVENMTIFIEEGELIVGNGASRPMGLEVEPLFGPVDEREIRQLEEEGFIEVSAEDWATLRELSSYWACENLQFRIGRLLDEARLWPFARTGLLLPPFRRREEGVGGWAQSGIGLGVNRWIGVVDFARVLNEGLSSLIAEAEERYRRLRFTDTMENVRRAHFLRAVVISLRAVIRLAERFAELAGELARHEADPHRQVELERIAQTCCWVPANPARNFYEALQSFWFIFLVVQQSTASAGRFDQYMYPFYRRDKDQGGITDAQVLELLELLRIKDMHLISAPLRGVKRQQYTGFAKWHNFTIGGVTPDGRDATNELTFLLLEAAQRVRTPHHTLTLRVHEATPDELMIKALEVVRTGIGLPAFIGDRSYIEFLLSRGVPLELARDYAVAGCIEVSLPGRSRQPKCTFFVPAKVLEVLLHEGVDPRTGLTIGPYAVKLESLQTYEQLEQCFKDYLAHSIRLAAELINLDIACAAQDASPIDSALMVGALEEGKSLMERRMPYENGGAISLCGMVNVADSLAAIRKLVYEEKRVSLRELVQALDANWEGYEELQRLCLEAPKYG
ncbi:MAG: formate C-acetyltransferase, partial [Chloroflexi bacterium]